MKVLFLDIDGVLNSVQSCMFYNEKGYDNGGLSVRDPKFCEYACMHLRNLLKEIPELKIVVSSTWRSGRSAEELQDLLSSSAGLPAGVVVAKTPKSDGPRGLEIMAWLSEHPEVERYVILDDDSDMQGCLEHLIQTDSRVGFSRADYEHVLKYMQHPWETTAYFNLSDSVESAGSAITRVETLGFTYYGYGAEPLSENLDKWAAYKHVTAERWKSFKKSPYGRPQGKLRREV